jgi:hypothetical protein
MAMNNRLLRPRDSGFSPKSIAGLQIWLDASDASSLTLNGSTVSQWRDKSGNGFHASQATANNQPTYTSSAVYGRPALSFDGSNDSMRISASLDATHSAFFVVKMNLRKIAGILGGSLNDDLIYLDGNTFSGTKYGACGIGFAVYGGGTITTGVYEIVSAVLSGSTLPSNLSMWTNGTGGPVTVATAGAAPAARMTANLHLGSSAGSHWLNGFIAEAIVYDVALAASQRQAVEKYLGTKYGISVA